MPFDSLFKEISSGFVCKLAAECSGCPWILKPYNQQLEAKGVHLMTALARAGVHYKEAIRVVSVRSDGLRDRADLTLECAPEYLRGTLGLYSQRSEGLVDIDECPAMSAALESWLQDFRAALARRPLGVRKGSVRLRVAPDGARGVWLDLANIDVKRLLDERAALDGLRELATVEIGQRRKHLVEREGRLKLADPELRPWFETYVGADEKAAPLYATIGSFTQPGFEANRALTREARAAFSATGAHEVLEFGSGNGNFTLPLAATGARVIACESDALACEGLARSLKESDLGNRVEIHRADFHAAKNAVTFADVDCVFVDPPRSGLKCFLDPLEASAFNARPRHFVYVSCFAESFAADLARLARLGYAIQSLVIVDQFPQSPHYEGIARLSLN